MRAENCTVGAVLTANIETINQVEQYFVRKVIRIRCGAIVNTAYD